MALVTRRWTAAVLTVLLPLGTTSAPLVQVHPDEPAAHDHGTALLHVHLPSRLAVKPPGPTFDHGDEGPARAVQVFIAVPVDPFDAPAVPRPRAALIVPPEVAVGRTPHVSHGHDPPAHHRLSPRAPPAFVS